MADNDLVIERLINAPVERVWRALTDPADLKKWMSFWPDFKAEVGFETEFMLGPAGKEYRHIVKVLEVAEEKRLTYTWDYGGMSPDSTTTFELFAEGDKTRLTLRCQIASIPSDQADFMKNASEGWSYAADSLKKFAESN